MAIKNLHFLKTIILSVCLCFSAYSFGQKIITGKVIDKENGAPLLSVHILNLEDSTSAISNQLGEFTLDKEGNCKFSILGYQTKQMNLKTGEHFIIQLQIHPVILNEVVVSASHIPQKLSQASSTIHVISQKKIEENNSTNISNLLNRVPGIYMHSGALNTNRITIRGIGSRNLYGTSKIRAYYEDIPLTSGDGATNIEDFELNSVARLEILKGGASSIYGAGLGGTIQLIPKKGLLHQTTISSGVTLGSYGLIKETVGINYGSKKYAVNAIYSNTHQDGYRENNQYNRQTITLTSNHFLSKKDELSFVGSYVNLNAFIPSSIDEETYINNPTSAAFSWSRAQGYEDTERGIYGLSWKHQYNDKLKHFTSVFGSHRNSYEPRPFNILSEETIATGIRSRLLGQESVLNRNLDWTVGGEFFIDWFQTKTFENLYKDFSTDIGSVEGDELSYFKEQRNYYNLFVETDYNVLSLTKVSLGLNFNQTQYELQDHFNLDPNTSQSGKYSFNGMLSPKIGVSHMFTKNIIAYGNMSHGFSPPTLAETLLPDGQINPAIQPETGWNYELGIRGSIVKQSLQYNLAIYRMDVRNLLVAKRTSQNEFIGVNAGRTLNDGVELTLDYQWFKSKIFTLLSYHTYALNNYMFKNFVDGDDDYSGNKLTGIPSNIFNTGIYFNTKLGLFGNIHYQYIGKMPITDDNKIFTTSYMLTNLKIGYQLTIKKKLNIKCNFGLNNIFNEKYASQILINASSWGASAPRYYYPGEPNNFYASIKVIYKL